MVPYLTFILPEIIVDGKRIPGIFRVLPHKGNNQYQSQYTHKAGLGAKPTTG